MERSRIRSVKWWQFHHAIWRYKILVASVIIIGTLASVIYTSRILKRYRSVSSAFLDNFSTQNAFDFSSPSSTDFSRPHKTLAESRQVKELAVARTKSNPELFGNCMMEARVDGALIYLSVIDGDPQVAAVLANGWLDAFIEELSRRSRSGGEIVQNTYMEQLKIDQGKLDLANQKQQDYYTATKYDPSLFLNDPIHQEVSRLELDRSKAEDMLRTLTDELAAFDDANIKTVKLSQLEHVKADLAFTDRLSKFREAESKLSEMKAIFADSHAPSVEQANSSLEQARQLLEEARANLKGALEIKQKIVREELRSKSEAYNTKKNELDTKQAGSITYKALSAEIEKHKHAVDQLNERLRENNLLIHTGHNNVIKWEAAEASIVPFVPNWRQNIGTGLLMSIVLACALVFALEQIDDTVRIPHDLEQRMEAIVLGAVPACGRKNMDRKGYFLAKEKSSSIAVDSMRGIHIALEVRRKSSASAGALVVNVTSAVPQDGKSFICSNLGILFAGLGRRVLVVDADLRKASLSKALGFDTKKGLFENLKSQVWNREYVIHCDNPGYDVLPAGCTDSSTSDSYNPESLGKLIEKMRKDYDVILFDTPPVLALPDACTLGQLADVTILVTRSRHTRLAQVERAAASLNAAHTKDLLFVVNGVDAVDAAAENYGVSYGYAYGYGYGYGKGYGYGGDGRGRKDSKRIADINASPVDLLDRKEEEEMDEAEREAIA